MKKIIIGLVALSSISAFAVDDRFVYECRQDTVFSKIFKTSSHSSEEVMFLKGENEKERLDLCYRLSNSLNLLSLKKSKEDERPNFSCQVSFLEKENKFLIDVVATFKNEDQHILVVNSYYGKPYFREADCNHYANKLNENF